MKIAFLTLSWANNCVDVILNTHQNFGTITFEKQKNALFVFHVNHKSKIVVKNSGVNFD